MVSLIILQLLVTPMYCWCYMWMLGYHGVFLVILTNLFISLHIALWDLYTLWIFDFSYFADFLVWLHLGNNNLITIGLSGTFLSLCLCIIMILGSFIVLSFVYIEMWDDKEGTNFAILLILFLAFMSILVTSSNLCIFYLGWEGIGFVSLFLISFWSERARAIKATLKVYTINKFGDFLIISSICLLLAHTGDTNFIFLNTFSLLLNNYYIIIGTFSINLIETTAILFVIGGGVKSAQFGFHIWLLEAMEAPLGASALMHSSTLVIAGVILVYKLANFINFTLIAHWTLILWGTWTTLFAALIACFQFELKIILAYSTISSMGFLYCLLGLSAYNVALNYLIIHAFIKIFLFLIIGAIMLHCGGCQDTRWMGGLLHYIPQLYIYYIAGSVSLAGLPYWSGYYCKSATWFTTITTNSLISIVHLVIFLTTICTYIYLARCGTLVFYGKKNGHHSIYRLRFYSPLLNIFLPIFGFIAIYGGIIWTHMCDTLLNAFLIDIHITYYIPLQLLNSLAYSAWWLLSQLYLIAFMCIYYLHLIHLNKLYFFFKYLYYLNSYIYIFLVAYICV